MTSSHPTRVLTVLFSAAASTAIAWSGSAAADPAKTSVAAAAPGDAAAPHAPAGDDGAATAATAAAEPAAPAARYPRAVIARPLTLPEGLAMLGADVTTNHDLSAMGGAPIVGYGITDDLEIQLPYAFAAREFEAKGSLNLDVGYKLLRGAIDGKLEAIARVRGGYNLLTQTANPVMLGVHVQYNLTDTFAIISGFPGTQQLSIAVSDGGVMGGSKPVDFSVPISAGYQATPTLYLQLDTRLARFNLSGSSNAFVFADTTPAALTAVYNVVNALDVQASIATDLSNAPGDALAFLIGARYYAGKL
ncbi:MAG TPA: hypothetical protein VGD37_33815 [Kofleriaceae bacterium]